MEALQSSDVLKAFSSAGKARSGTQIKIVNEKYKTLVTGEIGMIICKSDAVMAGYWQNTDATGEVLKGGWFITGDIGFLDQEGFLYILNRDKDIITYNGRIIFPRMLEEIIATHPNILNISVVQTTADSAVTAFIVSDKNDIDTRELGEKCSMYTLLI